MLASSSSSSSSCTNINTKNTLQKQNTIPIYRYQFSKEFMDSLFTFSKIHQYDDRHSYKENWNKWKNEEENATIIDAEIKRLTQLGYEGNIEEKMFNSGRYYFRKKPVTETEPKKRREYISMEKHMLQMMDIHISRMYQRNPDEFTPAKAFEEFCITNKDIIQEQVNLLLKKRHQDSEIKTHAREIVENIIYKIKKTFKNRYFRVSRMTNP